MTGQQSSPVSTVTIPALLALIPAAHAALLDRVAGASWLQRSVGIARAAGATVVRVVSTSAPILEHARALNCLVEHDHAIDHALESRGPRPALVIDPLYGALHVEVAHAAVNLLARESDAVVTTYPPGFKSDLAKPRTPGDIASRANGAIIALAPQVASIANALASPNLREITTEPSLALRVDRADDAIAIAAILRARSDQQTLAMFAAIDLIVFDFDGVMSNNQVLVMQDATEGALCNRSDGLGIGMLKKADIPAMVLSKEQNPVVGARCKKLGLECYQGIDDKLTHLQRLLSERGIDRARVAYVGNDLNDVACMQHVGLPIAVADAFEPALKVAQYVTRANGGFGAVREVIDLLLAAAPNSAGHR